MSGQFDTVVAGGTVVTDRRVWKADVGIRDGRIARVGEIGDGASGADVIDASGMLVLPGGVDEHVHPIYLDDVEETSLGALFGGTTTAMYFAYAKPGERLIDAVTAMIADGERRSHVDFTVHAGIFEAELQHKEIEAVAAEGVCSFKAFMTYASFGWATDDYQMVRVMQRVADVGGIMMVHAENGLAIDYLESEAMAGRGPGSTDVDVWLATRPAVLEAEAVFRVCALAEVADCRLFVPHVTCRRAMEVVAARRAAGQQVVAETCPQYLTLTDDALRHHGALAKIGPPLRTAEDADALWDGLRSGVLEAIGSDHAPKKTAEESSQALLTADFGAPGIETRLPIVYDAGVSEGRITLQRFVQAVSTNPARIFGLYPRKGVVLEGADADLVLWDPFAAYQLSATALHGNAGYTLHEGKECLGRPALVMQHGRVRVRDGELVSPEPAGRFVKGQEVSCLVDRAD